MTECKAVTMLSNGKAIEKLEQQLAVVSQLKQKESFSSDFQKWQRDTKIAIQNIFGHESDAAREFGEIKYSLSMMTTDTPNYVFERAFHSGLDKATSLLRSMITEIAEYRVDTSEPAPRNTFQILDRICSSFHRVVIQLRRRYADRATLDVVDEYDVQDLLHALLLIDFQDVRKEEWTPSYAGGSARVDFLLKTERTVVEVKKTRKGLGAREVGEQLLIDIGKYQAHQDCGAIFCFVYDPEHRVANCRGIENDLTKTHGNLPVKLIISP